MVEWPHSPSHAISERGTYIVTAATYGKHPVFRTRKHLTLLCEALLRGSSECDWKLQAWAAFPNHYHFVAESGTLEPLKVLIRRLHSQTARAVNALDGTAGRQVWFQYWDTRITNQRSYLARLHYVHENAVHHGLAKRAANYPWCSAGWFERMATPAFRREVLAFPCDRTRVPDSFEVELTS
jgi:putative transposase